MVDWSQAPDGAVDVRKGITGNVYFTDGINNFFSYSSLSWIPMSFAIHGWPIVEKSPIPATSPLNTTKPLHGQVIVLTGTFTAISREDAKRGLQQLGATISGAVTKNTLVVFAGIEVGSKVDKAKELGVEVRTESQLIELLSRNGITQPRNKYDREIVGKYGTGKCTVDVYRVLNAFGPLPPETQHAIKKLLAPGKRGVKDERQDLLEAIQSIEARLQYLEACDA